MNPRDVKSATPNQLTSVSVPLRGKGSVEPKEIVEIQEGWSDKFAYVSVPLRGKGSVELLLSKSARQSQEMFPSPCGERVLLNPMFPVRSARSLLTALFPSPCGERVLLNVRQSYVQKVSH